MRRTSTPTGTWRTSHRPTSLTLRLLSKHCLRTFNGLQHMRGMERRKTNKNKKREKVLCLLLTKHERATIARTEDESGNGGASWDTQRCNTTTSTELQPTKHFGRYHTAHNHIRNHHHHKTNHEEHQCHRPLLRHERAASLNQSSEANKTAHVELFVCLFAHVLGCVFIVRLFWVL